MRKEEIEKRLSSLPKGAITVKNIKGKNGSIYEYNFLQWTENGKRFSKRIKNEELDEVKKLLDERKKLENELKTYSYKVFISGDHTKEYNTSVIRDELLRMQVEKVKNFKKRNCFEDIKKYLYNFYEDKVLILYGLRRTGKTTLIRQVINDMNKDDFQKTAFQSP